MPLCTIDPVSILHPFNILKWLLYTLVLAVFSFYSETVAQIASEAVNLKKVSTAVEKEHDQIL